MVAHFKLFLFFFGVMEILLKMKKVDKKSELFF